MARSTPLRGSARSLCSGSAMSCSGSMLHTHHGGEEGQRSGCGAGEEGQISGAGGGEERRRGQQKRRAREQRAFSHPPLSPRPSRPPREGSVPSDSHTRLHTHIHTHALARLLSHTVSPLILLPLCVSCFPAEALKRSAAPLARSLCLSRVLSCRCCPRSEVEAL